MVFVVPVAPVGADTVPMAQPLPIRAPATDFGSLLTSGLAAVEARVGHADALVTAFARGDAVPIHEISLALEEARLSVEIAAEVRSRMLDVYRDFMTMQL